MTPLSVVVIGVTGYIASGKSSFCKHLQNCFLQKGHGCTTIDADVVARELRDSNSEVKKQIKELLGESVYDQNDRSIPSQIRLIYDGNHEELRKKYDTIFDIWVPKEIKNRIFQIVLENNASLPSKSQLAQNSPQYFVIIDCYCIYGYLRDTVNLIHYVVWIKTDIETQVSRCIHVLTNDQLKRLEMYRGKAREESLKWIHSQLSYEPAESFAHKVDFTFDNSGPDQDTLSQYAHEMCTSLFG